ncbi:MAG TPA: lipase family protein [Streptosporangiaceae bacterium]
MVAAFAIAAPLPGPLGSANAADCGAVCQAWQQQRQDALPRTGFYQPPDPLRWGAPGQLIRQQTTSEYQVQGSPVTATRILYHSRTSTGSDVAASGVVLVPPGTPPAGGWPVVVDAHGTSGIGRDCAPSLMRDLYHGNQMLQFLGQGWAVVAPDYAGMGTTGRVEFLNATAEASDVIDALRAARHALSALSHRWVLWGHSQGGGAALAVVQRMAQQPEPGYLGAVITAPAADLTAALVHTVSTPGLGVFPALVARGAAESDPAVRPDLVLTDQALEGLGVTRTGCLGVVTAVYAGLTGSALVRPGYLTASHLGDYLVRNSTGDQPVAGPILLLQGDADVVIARAATDRVAASLCRTGATVDYRTYPGLGHDTIPGVVTGIDDGAMPDILSWTAARFAGHAAPSTCSA